MKFHPTTPRGKTFLWSTITFLIIIISCSKDTQLLEDAVLLAPSTNVEEKESVDTEDVSEEVAEEVTKEEEIEEEITEKVPEEIRTTTFSPINDAHLQSGKGFDQSIVRLEEGRRTSYLMFDLSPIDSIGGTVTHTNLEITINTDDGNGTIAVYKGESNNWTEQDLSSENAPELGTELGEISTEYKVNSTHEIELDTANIEPNIITLVLTHKEGNDLAFASKEHTSNEGPKLVVSYSAPQGAEAILLEDDVATANTITEDTNTSTEETEQEESTEEPTSQEPDAQEEVEQENPTEAEAEEETPSEEAAVEEEAAPEEVAQEETQEVETTSEELAPVEEVNGAPVAAPKASPSSGEAPLEVQFDGKESTDDNAVTSYAWDFKDGSKADNADPSHIFKEPGKYEVLLTVGDENGLTNSRIVVITVNEAENEEPVALPKATPTSGEAPLEVQFTGDESTDDNGIAKYGWDFKDGSFANTANPSHTFTEPGEYKVVLSVEDEKGLSNSRIVNVTVTGAENEAPRAVASGSPLTGDAPLEVQFRGSDSKDDEDITGYFWDFKDGSSATSSNPSHTFSDPGDYAVELSVRDAEGLTHATTVNVKVNQPPTDTGGSGSGDTGGSDNGGSNDNPSNGVKASTFGYNSSDATRALEDAINSSHSTIIVDKQSSDWVVGPLYFNRMRNKTIIFEQGVVLRAKRGAFRSEDRLFQFVNSSDIDIQGYGATFQMNKSEYSGQQNHALSLITCSNVTVKGLTLRDAGGDGIYLSRYNEGDFCSNIRIEDVLSTGNRRQGITLLSVKGLVIKNSTFSNTGNKAPGAGIDFEPESTRDRFDDILIENCTFKDNYGPGVLFALSKVNGNSVPLDVTFRNTKLSNNGSTSNPRTPSEIDLGMSTNYRTNPIRGTVTFDGLRVENSKWSAIFTKKTLEAYHVNIKNAVIKDVSRGSNHPAIDIGVLSYANTSNANMGGFTFENVLIDYDGVDPSLRLHGPSHGNWNLRNMRGEIRVRSPRGVRFVDTTNKLSNTNSSSVTLRVVED